MGLHLPPNATLDGTSIQSIQDTLTRYGAYYRAPSLSPHTPKPYVIDTNNWNTKTHAQEYKHLHTLITKGFAHQSSKSPNTITLTDEGDALRTATLRNRVPLQKADNAFEHFKNKITRLKEEGISEVSEVWIYGSYMRREPSIGDIDICATTQDTIDIRERAEKIRTTCAAEHWYQKASQGGRSPISSQTYAQARLFGHDKPSPLFENGQTTLHSLTSMPVPCQRIYTKENGWVFEAPLDKHPQAPDQDPPNRKPRVTLTIDQGTFSSFNEGSPPPTRENTLKAKWKAAAEHTHIPTQRKTKNQERE